jgi:hypothetical protein
MHETKYVRSPISKDLRMPEPINYGSISVRVPAAEGSACTGRNGTFGMTALLATHVPSGDWVHLDFVSPTGKVLNAGARVDGPAFDALCLQWCRERGLLEDAP